jgi:hypothetical protein
LAPASRARYDFGTMTWRGRSFWLALALVLYVCAAHLRAEPGSTRAWLSLVLGPMLLAFGWRLARAPAVGVDWIEPGARAAARVVAAGTAVVTVADLAPESPAFVVARVFGLGLGTTAAPVALARIGALRATAVRPLAHGKDAAIATAAMWLAAFGLAAWRELVPGSKIDALAIDYSVVAAGLGSMGVVMVCAWRVYAARRFELGVSERAAGALWLGVLCLAVGCIAALMEVGAPERIVPVCALLSAIAAASCAISQRPELVSRVLRTAASATMLATPLMCVAVIVARARTRQVVTCARASDRGGESPRATPSRDRGIVGDS